jgi:hypothetical protein
MCSAWKSGRKRQAWSKVKIGPERARIAEWAQHCREASCAKRWRCLLLERDDVLKHAWLWLLVIQLRTCPWSFGLELAESTIGSRDESLRLLRQVLTFYQKLSSYERATDVAGWTWVVDTRRKGKGDFPGVACQCMGCGVVMMKMLETVSIE